MPIKGDTALSSFSGKELAESSAIHGDFNQASINYSGHQNLEVRGAEDMDGRVVNIVGGVGDKVYVTIRFPATNEYYGYDKIFVGEMEDVMLAESFGAEPFGVKCNDPHNKGCGKRDYATRLFNICHDCQEEMRAESFGADGEEYTVVMSGFLTDDGSGEKEFTGTEQELKDMLYDFMIEDRFDKLLWETDGDEEEAERIDLERWNKKSLEQICDDNEYLTLRKSFGADWDVSVDKVTHQKQTFHVKDKDYESQAKRKALSLAKKKKGGWKNYPEGAGFATPEYEVWLARRARAESFGAEYGKRQRFGNRYVARDTKGKFISNVSVGRSLKADRRNKSKTPARSGFGHKGDAQKAVSGGFKLPTDAKSLVGIGAVLGGLWAYLESKA